MKTCVFLLLMCLVLPMGSCTTEKGCLQRKGVYAQRVDEVPYFTTLEIPAGVEVEIIQQSPARVTIHSTSQRIDQITTEVNDKKLVIANTNTCNLWHDYKVARIQVYTPVLEKIISKTQFKVFSEQTLSYPQLSVLTSVNGPTASSEIDLKVNVTSLTIEDNQVARYTISGTAEKLEVYLYGGNPRVDASALHAQEVTVFHRSSNDVQLYPIKSVKGTLLSTGNLILHHLPQQLEVEQKYTGKVLYF